LSTNDVSRPGPGFHVGPPIVIQQLQRRTDGNVFRRIVLALTAVMTGAMLTGSGCPKPAPPPDTSNDLFAPIGQPVPFATPDQLGAFDRGKAVALRRFKLSEGLGPTFNVTFCTACHERPAIGGGAARYRNFFISGTRTPDGKFTLGTTGGVIRVFHYGAGDLARPVIPPDRNVFAQRKAIPFFGVGLLAEVTEGEILSRADPDDADGDGISGRPNFDGALIGRLGRKCQTASIEGFIRGPLFNHVGVTSDPLTNDDRARLPVDISIAGNAKRRNKDIHPLSEQAAAPDAPTVDNDGIPDPEMGHDDLFDLVSFAMLLAPPAPQTTSARAIAGKALFEQARCTSCHVPALKSPRGDLPAYTDLLIHDMGSGLADGIEQGVATGSEFRTQPLWGIAAVGPYLHDGRADTLQDAILAHGGEASDARNAFAAFSLEDQQKVVDFLLSLGGADQYSTGLLPPDAPIPAVGEYGGPRRDLNDYEKTLFLLGREVMDRDFNQAQGLGGLAGADGGGRFNGDSCRSCHQDPVIGGAGPRDVNVMRHGILTGGVFSASIDAPNTILHKEIALGFGPIRPAADVNVFEHRQTPHLFGLGLIDAISDATILSHADPNDADSDGISGRAHVLADNRVGRFGWKANVPSLREFLRDAFGGELGLSIPAESGLSFGFLQDMDSVLDPEVPFDELNNLDFFARMLGPPPRQANAQDSDVLHGQQVFADVGCVKCHIPSLPAVVEGAAVDVPLYSDLLLHSILPAGKAGIEDGTAGMRQFRTAPLWGLSHTAPYFHSGEADTIDQAVRLHDGEAASIRQLYIQLSDDDRSALLAFLGSL
jgi:CxxC motif-containing protein (DUF1111 family)